MYTVVEKLVDEMYKSGYSIGARSEEVLALDAEIVERLRCRECGGTLTYFPFYKEGSYRPFTICDECGNTREF